MNPRYVLTFLRLFKMPGMLPVMKDWQAFLRTLFLYAAYDTGLLRALAPAPCSREALAQKLAVAHPELLDALLDVGLATKELGLQDQQYFLKGKRARAMVDPRGDMVAAMIQANVTYYGDAYRHAAQRLQGGELGDDLADIGEVVARFAKGIEPIVRDYIKAIVTGKPSLRILDVGCGSAFFLRSAHQVNPQACGVGLDLDPAVVRQARENLAAWGLGQRFSIAQGDIRHPPGEVSGAFDLINLYNLLYYFSAQERADLLADLRARLTPTGMLSVVMNFASQGRDLAAANLNLVNCSLKGLHPLPSLEEISQVLERCGFRRLQVHHFLPASTFLGITAQL